MINCREPKTYWIIFKKGMGWYCSFMKQDFGHCLILTQDKFNWYICDPMRRRFEFKILSCDPKYNLPYFLRTQEGHKLIKIVMNNKEINWVPSWTCLSCVEIVKYILSLKISAFTPWQLYKRLRNMQSNLFKQYSYGINSIICM